MDGSGRDCVFEAGETARSHRKVALSDSFRVRHGDEFAKLLGGGVVAENNPSDCRQHKYCDPDCGLWLGASPDELENRHGCRCRGGCAISGYGKRRTSYRLSALEAELRFIGQLRTALTTEWNNCRGRVRRDLNRL